MENLNGKIVFITGGSSGYGKATAKALANAGACVIIAARNKDKLSIAKNETGCDDIFAMDVTNYSDWEKAEEYIRNKYGRIDILINNAGGGVAIKDTVDQSAEDIDAAIRLNLNSVIYGSQIFGRKMKKQKNGTIINFSSVCAKEAWQGWSVYAASKWGVLGFSKGLYVEMRPYNVRVSCIVPAAASTGFQKSSGIGEIEAQLKTEDIAETVLYICSLPQHAVVEEVTVWGIDQEVNPL
mgnify:CR=1 FL=1